MKRKIRLGRDCRISARRGIPGMLVVICALLGMTASPRLMAATIFSNLPVTTSSVVESLFCSGTSPYCFNQTVSAMGFQMPAGNSYLLNSVDLALDAPYTATNDISIQIFSDSSGHPGSALLTLITPQLTGYPGIFDAIFIAPGAFYLEPNTSYWIVGTNSDPNPYNVVAWVGNFPAVSPTGVPSYLGSLDNVGGSGWVSDAPAGLSIDATAVPELSSALLFLSGVLFVAVLHARFLMRRKLASAVQSSASD
jgi:hypothetical protein